MNEKELMSLVNDFDTLCPSRNNGRMSLGIVFKGPEGIVLAADSRVTLMAGQAPQQPVPGAPPIHTQIPVWYDNATKLLSLSNQTHVGAVTYGAGAIGTLSPRTAHSFLPELEAQLATTPRLTVAAFAQTLSDFFVARWQAEMTTPYVGPDMVFVVGGYDDGEAYGRVYEFYIPSNPAPVEQQQGTFGMVWGGQREYTDRLIQGFDQRVPALAQQHLGLDDTQRDALWQHLRQLQAPIPFQFLPLQDCVDLAVFLIRTTIKLQTWLVDIRGVGGAIDVATITRMDGFAPVQLKTIHGEL